MSTSTATAWGEEDGLRDSQDGEFQATVATSQSALQFAAISEDEKKSMRSELQSYLSELSGRKGSDGNLLVHVPANFDEVANAMDRDDLETPDHHSFAGAGARAGGSTAQKGEEVPWSKYLLSQDLSYESSLGIERGGGAKQQTPRAYSAGGDGGKKRQSPQFVNGNENTDGGDRLQEALSRMRLLDSRLRTVNRKDLQLKHDLNSRSIRDNDSMYSGGDTSAPTSGRMSARSLASERSRMNDVTFLTRARSEKGSIQGGDTTGGSTMSSPQMSARTVDTDSMPDSPNANLYPIEPEEEEEDVDEEEHKERSPSSKQEKLVAGRPLSILQKNILHSGRHTKPVSSLTDAEELRLRYLLDLPESSAEWQALARFGYTVDQIEQVQMLDVQLSAFGHMDRLTATGAGAVEEAAGENHDHEEEEQEQERPDYLRKQRLERETSKVTKKLDMTLKKLTQSKADLSGLVGVAGPSIGEEEEGIAAYHISKATEICVGGDENANANEPLSASDFSLLNVPLYSSLPASGNRHIGHKDIANLLSAAKKLHQPYVTMNVKAVPSAQGEGEDEEEEEENPFSISQVFQHEHDEHQQHNDDDQHVHPSSLLSPSLRREHASQPQPQPQPQPLASRQRIDQLLGSLRLEVNRLTSLREQLLSVMNNGGNRDEYDEKQGHAEGKRNDIGGSGFKLNLSDYDDDVQETGMRYGYGQSPTTKEQPPTQATAGATAAAGLVGAGPGGKTAVLVNPAEFRLKLEKLKQSQANKADKAAAKKEKEKQQSQHVQGDVGVGLDVANLKKGAIGLDRRGGGGEEIAKRADTGAGTGTLNSPAWKGIGPGKDEEEGERGREFNTENNNTNTLPPHPATGVDVAIVPPSLPRKLVV